MTKKDFGDSLLAKTQDDYMKEGKTPAQVTMEALEPKESDKPKAAAKKKDETAKPRKASDKDAQSLQLAVFGSYEEKRSERLNILITPSLKEQVEKTAKDMQISVNEFVHKALEAAVARAEKALNKK